jgi:hypothetical protein
MRYRREPLFLMRNVRICINRYIVVFIGFVVDRLQK